ncbi:MAG: hypothetical protein ABJA83_16220 [Burkholderiaceae bacterium]
MKLTILLCIFFLLLFLDSAVTCGFARLVATEILRTFAASEYSAAKAVVVAALIGNHIALPFTRDCGTFARAYPKVTWNWATWRRSRMFGQAK